MTTAKMSRKEYLITQMAILREELIGILDSESILANNWLVGKYFKVINGYSIPGPDETWWLYKHVAKLDKEGEPFGWAFQQDCDGYVSIEPNVRLYLDAEHQEITAVEFANAYQEILEFLNQVHISVDLKGEQNAKEQNAHS